MSLSSSPAGGKGVDSNAVDTYDSGDEWDIGVGNLIIDLDADLEKDKLEMSSSKEGGGMAAPPGAVAVLPDNIKFVSPVAAMQSKDGKSKSKRSKNSKEGGKTSVLEAAKKEAQSRTQGDLNPGAAPSKGADAKVGKASRKDAACGKSKKEKLEAAATRMANSEKDSVVAPRNSSFENPLNPDLSPVDQFGNLALDSAGISQVVTMVTEEEVDDGSDCRSLKKVASGEKVRESKSCFFYVSKLGWVKTTPSYDVSLSVIFLLQMESPFSSSAPPPPLHLLGAAANSGDISSPCEQIMVRTRSVAVNTAEAALATEPECLGPCEPGTSVNLEGIVWQETEDGEQTINLPSAS